MTTGAQTSINMTKKNPLSFHVKVSEREMEMMNFIKDQEGHHTLARVLLHSLLSYYNKQYYDKRSTDPQRKISDETMTPEQKCESMGGKVDEKDQTCRVSTGALTEVTPLSLL